MLRDHVAKGGEARSKKHRADRKCQYAQWVWNPQHRMTFEAVLPWPGERVGNSPDGFGDSFIQSMGMGALFMVSPGPRARPSGVLWLHFWCLDDSLLRFCLKKPHLWFKIQLSFHFLPKILNSLGESFCPLCFPKLCSSTCYSFLVHVRSSVPVWHLAKGVLNF